MPTGTTKVGTFGYVAVVDKDGNVTDNAGGSGGGSSASGPQPDATSTSVVNSTGAPFRVQIKDTNGADFAGGTAIASGTVPAGQLVFPVRSYPVLSDGTNFTPARGDTNGAYTQGNVASGVADAGNPVKVGGVARNNYPTAAANGARQSAWMTQNGAAVVGGVLVGATRPSVTATWFPAANNTDDSAPLGVLNGVWNGSNSEPMRKPNGFSRITSTAATGSPTVAKSSAGDLSTFFGKVAGTQDVFLQLYNKGSAPVIGTDTPVLTFPCIASQGFNAPAGLKETYFSTGLAYSFTSDAAGTTAAAAGAVIAFSLTYA